MTITLNSYTLNYFDGKQQKKIASVNNQLREVKVPSKSVQKSYSLIIPAYNEENRIAGFLKSLSPFIFSFDEILAICDGNDKTAEIIKTEIPRIKVVEYEKRLGKGGAILEGFRLAQGDVIGYVDADGSISPEDALRVFASVNSDTSVSIGSRWLKDSKVLNKQPLTRIILGRLYHYLAFTLLGIREKDIQCGVKAFNKELIEALQSKVTVKNFSFDTAVLFHCKKMFKKISEVPISWKDVSGSRVNPLRESIVMFATLIGLFLANSKRMNVFFNRLFEVDIGI